VSFAQLLLRYLHWAFAPKVAKEKVAKGPGVIKTIIETISREKGATADEILEILVKRRSRIAKRTACARRC
jgi:hypothetical protein